jgi:hypothetical protein
MLGLPQPKPKMYNACISGYNNWQGYDELWKLYGFIKTAIKCQAVKF